MEPGLFCTKLSPDVVLTPAVDWALLGGTKPAEFAAWLPPGAWPGAGS